MPFPSGNALRRRIKVHSMKLLLCPRPSPFPKRKKHQYPERKVSKLLGGKKVTPWASPAQLSPTKSPARSSSFYFSFPSSSSSTMARKLTKMPSAKKRPKNGSGQLVIGAPQNFRQVPLETNLLDELGMQTLPTLPTLRGGGDAGSRPSVLSLRSFAKEQRLPPRADPVTPKLEHRHTAPPQVSLPNPLQSNPPVMPPRPAPPPPVFELDGCNARLSETSRIRSRDNSSGSHADRNSKPKRHSVFHVHFHKNLSLLPIMKEVDDILLPESEASPTIGQDPPINKVKSEPVSKSADRSGRSDLPYVPLPLEASEYQEIYSEYKKTGNIHVDSCSDSFDENGDYTWMHCWDLINTYTFGASYMDDTEFADEVMDKLCEKIKLGKGADIDTITLIFTGKHMSSQLKRLVVDRCIDAGAKGFHRSVIKRLPRDFTFLALEMAVERLNSPEWLEQSQSPCRYHRHKRPEDCWLRKSRERDQRVTASIPLNYDLRKLARERDQVNIANRPEDYNSRVFARKRDQLIKKNRKARESRVVDVEEPVRQSGESQEPVEQPAVVEVGKADDQSTSMEREAGSIASVQETELDMSESSVMATLGFEDDSVSMAKSCKIVKPMGAISLISVASTPPPEIFRNSSRSSKTAQQDRRVPSPRNEWPRLSQLTICDDVSLPGSYPESVISC